MDSPEEELGVSLAQAPKVRTAEIASTKGASLFLTVFIFSFLSVSDRISFRPSGLPESGCPQDFFGLLGLGFGVLLRLFVFVEIGPFVFVVGLG
jgi:hypothetical protein